jgi:hypothetical protein
MARCSRHRLAELRAVLGGVAMRSQQESSRAACHEAAHAVLGVVLMRGVHFCDIVETADTETEKGNSGWTQFVNYETPKTAQGLLPFVICYYAGHAAQRLLFGMKYNESIAVCTMDWKLVEKMIASLPDDAKHSLRWHGVAEALLYVHRYRAPILELAEELLKYGRVNGDRVRQIVEAAR